jgi:hypothetical protein
MGRPFKLTDHQKREAIERREQGATLAELARSCGMGKSTISRLGIDDLRKKQVTRRGRKEKAE